MGLGADSLLRIRFRSGLPIQGSEGAAVSIIPCYISNIGVFSSDETYNHWWYGSTYCPCIHNKKFRGTEIQDVQELLWISLYKQFWKMPDEE